MNMVAMGNLEMIQQALAGDENAARLLNGARNYCEQLRR
jgi:hypothetical protein